jgi:alanyl-tRNA synthetase
VVDVMGGHYTELVERQDAIKRVITQEEERFHRTLDRGLSELETELAQLAAQGKTELSGEVAFYLKATLGLPIQVTKDIVEERGFTVDMAGFQASEAQHAEVSGGGQAMGLIASADVYNATLSQLKQDGLLGEGGVHYQPYGPTALEDQILALLQDGERVNSVMTGDRVEVVLGTTPFYVEAGGQVSDTGVISGDGWRIEVEDTRRPVGGLIAHIGEVVEGQPREGDAARAEVDGRRRADITRNHTATHLLHAALRNHLGTHVQQRGSLVAPDRLRFDFAHDAKVGPEELKQIETEVNQVVLANYPVQAEEKSLAQARQEGAMALFGEKYGERVRTIVIDDPRGSRYSYELCGGVHVSETAEIGPFLIVSEGSVSAGIRRVEALTGAGAVEYIQNKIGAINHLAAQLSATPDTLPERIAALQAELNHARKHTAQLQRELARQTFERLLGSLEQLNGKQALIAQIDEVPADTLREMADWFRDSVKSGVMVLGSVSDGRPQILVAVTDDLTRQGLHAGNLVKQVAAVVGGGGGGRPTMAQAGGKDASKIGAALETARSLIADS